MPTESRVRFGLACYNHEYTTEMVVCAMLRDAGAIIRLSRETSLIGSGEPVSMLFYGEPGTGKTKFAGALAKRLGRGAIFAGLTDNQGKEPDRDERLEHLMFLREDTG